MAERDFAQAGVFVRNFKNPSSTLIDDLVVIHSIGPQEPHELGVKSASGDLVPSEFPIRFAQELRSLYPVEREEAGAEGDASEPCRKRPTPRTPDTLDGLPPSRGDKWKHDKQARREQKQWDKFEGRVIEQCLPEMAARDKRDDEQFRQEMAAREYKEQREADANDKNDKNDGQDKTTAITRTRSRSRITNPPSVRIRSRGQRFAADCKCWLCTFCAPLQHCRCGSEGRCQSIDCRARHR